MDTIYIKNFMTSIFGNSESDRILNIEGRTEEAITKLLDVLPKEQRELWICAIRVMGWMLRQRQWELQLKKQSNLRH